LHCRELSFPRSRSDTYFIASIAVAWIIYTSR
jgi:hypothetical protein